MNNILLFNKMISKIENYANKQKLQFYKQFINV